MPSLNNVRLGVRIGAILGVLVIAAVGATALLSADVQSDLVSRFGERQLQTLSRRFQAQIDDQAQRAVDMASLQINEIATSIAAAVEEQGAATQEIARNVEEAAEGTRNVSATMQGLNDNAHKTGTAAAEVLTAADRLHRESSGLGTEVHEFLQKMQA